jgi:hypothetical protein
VFANRDLKLDIACVFVANDLDDFANGIVVRRWLFCNLGDDDLVERRFVEFVLRDDDVLIDPTFSGDHEPHAVFRLQFPNDTMICALDNRYDLTRDFVVARETRDLYRDAIAVQHGAHFVVRQKEIVAALIELRESVSIGMADDRCQ